MKRERNFEFNWNEYKNHEVYKLAINNNEILGLMYVLGHPSPEDNHLEIVLIEVRKDQRGSLKRYDRIAGCLIAFAADLSFSLNHDGFLALTSKIETAAIYHHKYGIYYLVTIRGHGPRMASNEENSRALIDRYLQD